MPASNPGEDRPMAKSLNRVDLLGYLGTDANIKEIAHGTSVGEVSVATDYSVKDAVGKWTERTEWHSVVIWGAASASEVLVKGARVHLTGRLRTRSWDKDGERRHKTEVVCGARDVIVTAPPKDGTDPAPQAAPERDDDGIPY